MQAFYDGSYTWKGAGGKSFPNGARYVSWGLVFSEADTVVEVHGSRKVHHSFGSGFHELIACVECTLWLHSHGYSPDKVGFVTDDELTVYGRHATVENGYAFRGQGDRLRWATEELVRRRFFTQEAMDVCWTYLLDSRFTKVKGHARTVYNERCDYLAKFACRSEATGNTHFMELDDWLNNGFNVFGSEGTSNTVHAPFVQVF